MIRSIVSNRDASRTVLAANDKIPSTAVTAYLAYTEYFQRSSVLYGDNLSSARRDHTYISVGSRCVCSLHPAAIIPSKYNHAVNLEPFFADTSFGESFANQP